VTGTAAEPFLSLGDALDPAGYGCYVAFPFGGTVRPFPFVITGVGLLGYWATHPPPLSLVAEPLIEGPTPLLSLRSVDLQPVRNGLGAGLTFSF
jgi:hypothetical protein